ncbi:hypothetical protein ACHWQZ_G014799 [Mnemiopsis leidyi]
MGEESRSYTEGEQNVGDTEEFGVSSAQRQKEEHSTKHAVKKDLEHLNEVRLVTRRVSSGEHSRKKHNTDSRTRRKRGGNVAIVTSRQGGNVAIVTSRQGGNVAKVTSRQGEKSGGGGGRSVSLNLAPSVQEEQREEEEREEREEIVVVRSVALSRSYLSFRCKYIRGRTNTRVLYQYKGDLKSGQLLVENRGERRERREGRESRERREGRERRESRESRELESREGREGREELDSWRNQSVCSHLGKPAISDIEDWRLQTFHQSSELHSVLSTDSDCSLPVDVTTDGDVTTFKEGDIRSVRRVNSLAPFLALPLDLITHASSPGAGFVAAVSVFSDSEDESALLDVQHVQEHVEHTVVQHVQYSGRETGMFIKNGRSDSQIHRDVAYKHFPHFHEKEKWVKPVMFRNFL